MNTNQNRAISFITEWLHHMADGGQIDMTVERTQSEAQRAEMKVAAIKIVGGYIKQPTWTKYPNLLEPCCGNPSETLANQDVARYSLDDPSPNAHEAHEALARALIRLGIDKTFGLDKYGPMNAEIFEFMQKLLRGSHDDNLTQKYQPFGYPFVRASMFSSSKKPRTQESSQESW